MAIRKKQKSGLLGKLIVLVIVAGVGGAAFLAFEDTPPPQKAVTKVIQNPNLQ